MGWNSKTKKTNHLYATQGCIIELESAVQNANANLIDACDCFDTAPRQVARPASESIDVTSSIVTKL